MAPTLTLPGQGRRACIRGFWLTLGLLLAAPFLLAGWWLESSVFVVAAIAVALLTASPALASERFARRGYHAWNARVVRPSSVLVTRAVLAICFFIIFLAVGRVPSKTRVAVAGGTRWSPRRSLEPNAYRLPYAAAAADDGSTGWIAGYLRWAWRTGNTWSVSLLPFLIVLKLLPQDGDNAPLANIYTLF
jgi:hypothetical protein